MSEFLGDLLTTEEREVLARVRAFTREAVAPMPRGGSASGF